MDSLIKRFDSVPDGDLMQVEHKGIAYQANMKKARVRYDDAYWDKVCSYEDSPIAREVNAARCAMLQRHLKQGATVLDYGAGSGAFVRAANAAGFRVKGFDVIPAAVRMLMKDGLYSNDPHGFDAVTMWDVIEHMDMPGLVFKAISKGAMLFASIPVFENLQKIRRSKHYRPGEHLLYFREP